MAANVFVCRGGGIDGDPQELVELEERDGRAEREELLVLFCLLGQGLTSFESSESRRA